MRLWFSTLVLFLLVVSIPFVIGVNASDAFIVENSSQTNQTNFSEYELLDQVLSENSTTNFSEFLDKEFGVYYGDETQYDSNTSSGFDSNSDLIMIEDNLTEYDSIYVPIQDIDKTPRAQAIALDDSNILALVEVGDVTITFGKLVQSPLVEGENVNWTQIITVENVGAQKDQTLNLWSYDDILDRSFLWDVVKASMSVDGQQISQTPVGVISVNTGETVTVIVEFQTPAVTYVKDCFDVTIGDLIPSDATIIESTVEDYSIVVQSICTAEISYPAGLRYKQVKFI